MGIIPVHTTGLRRTINWTLSYMAGRLKIKSLHPWDVELAQAREIQQRLREKVDTRNRLDRVEHVAGVDVGFEDNNRITRAAVAVLRLDGLELVDQTIARRETSFPYVPGFLSFREIPAVLDALALLQTVPDLVLCDGQGIAHPRRFGIACHLGVLTDLPTIGVAKSRLTGTHNSVPDRRGGWTFLLDGEETIGAVLRTRKGVNPVYVSIGHRVDLPTAVEYVMRCTTRYRLPETTRHAHRLASG